MKALICIDDTDSLDKTTSTGAIAGYIKKAIKECNLGICEDVTRHQLLIHPDIPYTSHNSSMCFEAEISEECKTEIIVKAAGIIMENMAAEADPGLCVCIPEFLNEKDKMRLIGFGELAKKEVLTKEAAYDLAGCLGIHLSEHGGTGQGIIGALAGAGLRLGGNDGRYKGKMNVVASREDGLVSVDEICRQTRSAEVRDLQGNVLAGNQMIELGEYAKAVRKDSKKVVIVMPKADGTYITCTKEQLEGAE